MKTTGAVLSATDTPGPYRVTQPLTVCELDLADPGPREILVRIECAGLCHSDLSVIDGNRRRPLPMLLGHEAAGIVEQVGRDVTRAKVGQRVVMTFLPRCGECEGCKSNGVRPCVAGSTSNERGDLLSGSKRLSHDGQPVHHHLGVSAFATLAVVDERSIVPVKDDVPPTVAALLGCAVLTGGGAVLNVRRPTPGQTVMVVGLGGVGMAAVLTAASLPGVSVIGVDALPAKVEAAADFGAHESLTPEAAAERGLVADLVIEAAGNVRAFEFAVGALAPGGTAVTVGLPSPDARASISPLALVGGGRSIVGSYLGSTVPIRDIPVFADLWRQGRLPVERLVTGTIPLSSINEGLDELASGRAIRQIIDFAL